MKLEKFRDLYEAAYFQFHLEDTAYKLVFVDEFHVAMKTSWIYNWSIKGHPAIISADNDSWVMNFVVAMSSDGIEGITTSNSSINSTTK